MAEYVTLNQLRELGWKNITQHGVNGLNNMFKRFGITTKYRVRVFIAQSSRETGNGSDILEKGNPEKIEQAYDGYLGNNDSTDGYKYRGAGYLQLTYKDNYKDFQNHEHDHKIVNKGADYVADNYPFESAGFFWVEHNMNNLCGSGSTFAQLTQQIVGSEVSDQEIQERYNIYTSVKSVIK